MKKCQVKIPLVAALLATPFMAVNAKVVFTGYGDIQTSPQAWYRIEGSPAVLNLFKIAPQTLESRGTRIDSLGLFATTSLSDNTRALVDITYRDIGVNAKTIRLQYAYVEHSAYGGQGQIGKIALPFGYYNQNRFYPFQRASISAPVFQGSILGLPISDLGATVGKTFEPSDFLVRADVYGVNGFGPIPGSTTSLRSGTLPGGLSISNNIASQDLNHRIAVGGRLEFGHKVLPDSVVGVSYYRDQWDPAGQGLFQMGGAHLHAVYSGLDVLTEYLVLTAKGDEGLMQNFGSRYWRTDGFFTTVEYKNLSLFQKQVTPWVRFEDYFTHGAEGGHEALWDVAGGAAVKLLDGVSAKIEVSDLYYKLPFKDLGDLTLRGYSILFGLAVTF